MGKGDSTFYIDGKNQFSICGSNAIYLHDDYTVWMIRGRDITVFGETGATAAAIAWATLILTASLMPAAA